MEEISRFIFNNAWSFVALLPAVILLVLAGALRGTSVKVVNKQRPLRIPLAMVIGFQEFNGSVWRLTK